MESYTPKIDTFMQTNQDKKAHKISMWVSNSEGNFCMEKFLTLRQLNSNKTQLTPFSQYKDNKTQHVPIISIPVDKDQKVEAKMVLRFFDLSRECPENGKWERGDVAFFV